MAETAFDFEQLAAASALRRYEPEARIFVQGDDGNCMYVVRSGRVGIVSNGAVLETVGPGQTFGEVALLDGSPRSASAIAREATEVAVIDEATFLMLLQKNPAFGLDLLRRMARRLRQMNDNQ